MNKNLLKSGVALATLLISSQSWSQCAQITCPSDVTITAPGAACDVAYTYGVPVGVDACQSASDTLWYSGSIASYTIPAGVTSVTIEARGAQGSNNTSSGVTAGLGAIMIGDFTVTPGQVLSVLVGQQFSAAGGNGGGGGTFVVDALNNPLIVAGGGGGSAQSTDSPNKHGQVGTTGGTGAAGGGLGGTNGSGGYIGATFASGAGGGLLTNGQDGWTSNTGGLSFLNGGSGGTSNGNAQGGFGGGGSGSSYVVGGGGGGYSGGGSGSNSTGAGVGGGGGSYNAGTNQNNTGGANTGHGMVVITYYTSASTSMIAGLGSGSNFPLGTTTETYVAYVSPTDSATCSFNITVIDTVAPVITVPTDVQSCSSAVSNIAASATDPCGGEVITYTMTGATTGSGSGDVSGTTFNQGTTTIWYYATDISGNVDSASFDVTVFPTTAVSLAAFADDTICSYDSPVTLPAGTPASGVYSGPGVAGVYFDPSAAGIGAHTITYTYTDTNGCQNAATTMITVDGCATVADLMSSNLFKVYPNPGTGIYHIEFDNQSGEEVHIQLIDVNGRNFYSATSNDAEVHEIMDISHAANGLYILEVSTGSQKVVKQIVKK